MSNDLRAVVVAYVVAGLVAVIVGFGGASHGALHTAFWADVTATVAIFLFSWFYRNSSFYDAYWSVAPIALVAYWAAMAPAGAATAWRQVLVAALVATWGLRLTYNWYRGWEGLEHEDWRYVDLRRKTGRFYWLVSFAGIHMVPTLVVFGGCLPVWAALSAGAAPLSWIDGLALAITGIAIALEARADQELLRFRQEPHDKDAFLRSGLWAWSRHPNYVGEIGFWWGLWVFALAADLRWWWTGVGALAVTLLFRIVSLPMIEGRMRARRPAYGAYAARSSMLLPTIPRREKEERT